MTKQTVTTEIQLKGMWGGKLSGLLGRINGRIDHVIEYNKWNLADVDFDNIVLDADTLTDYCGGTTLTLYATIPRLETDEEYACRWKCEKRDIERMERQLALQEIHEKQELVRLAAKFGKNLV